MAREKKSRILEYFGLGDSDDYEDEEYFDEEEEETEQQPRSNRYDEQRNEGFFRRNKKTRVVPVQERAKSSVVIFSPKSYSDAQPLVMHLIQNKHVIVKLDKVERAVGQRILDFMSGAAYASDAQVTEVAHGSIYLFASNQTYIDQPEESGSSNRESRGLVLDDEDQF